MAKIRFTGPLSVRLYSMLTLIKITLETYVRHTFGKRLEPSWSAEIEIGIRFWRNQFTKAMRHKDITKGRQIFNSLMTETNDEYTVNTKKQSVPLGDWYHQTNNKKEVTVLYFHGGGYTFNGPMSERFAAMFAHHTKTTLFAANYRLTPEHPHPAQMEDALNAWYYVTEKTPAEKIIVMGDSAGGHMALMLLQDLKQKKLPQPMLCIGLCPWTDIGDRGKSLNENDKYDLVQGWMALQFGNWLNLEGGFSRDALSPIYQDYSGLAPLYLQTGGREILHDMICDFATIQEKNGATIMLECWDDMPHNFQAYDSLKQSSKQALSRIREIINIHIDESKPITSLNKNTLVASECFLKNRH